jgi:hypothetical protein
MTRIPARLAAILVLLFPTLSVAHDFFLLPETFVTTGTADTPIMATVSAGFPALEIVVAADRISWVGAKGAGSPELRISEPVSNAAVLLLGASEPGFVVAGASTRTREVDYGEDVIDLILEEYRVGPDALAAIGALDRPRTLSASSRRFAKTFVCVRDCEDRATVAQPLGMALEFVGVDGSGDTLVLLRDGTPLADYPVDLVTSDGIRSHLGTDAQGRVALPPDASGAVMLFAAFMQPPQGEARFDLQLTSLTLERR